MDAEHFFLGYLFVIFSSKNVYKSKSIEETYFPAYSTDPIAYCLQLKPPEFRELLQSNSYCENECTCVGACTVEDDNTCTGKVTYFTNFWEFSKIF